KDELSQRHGALLAARRQRLERQLQPVLPPWARPDILDRFFAVLAELTTLPPSLASVRAEETGPLLQDLVLGMADTLTGAVRGLPSRRLDPATRQTALRALMASLAQHSSSAAEAPPEWLPTLLAALETLLQASDLDLSNLTVAPDVSRQLVEVR